jgi:hypothetical protein
VLWGIAVFKHRRAGGISTYAGSESGVPDYPGSSEEGTGSGNRTASDNTNMEQINGDGTASGNVSREQMNGSWNTSDNANSAMDGNTSDDVNMDPGDGNRNTSNNVTSHNRKSIHYVPDHPYHPLRMHPIDGNRNTSQDQTSVHYVAAHPHHPLRMHPVDSTSTIRSVAPDVIQNSKKTIEKAEQVPASPNSAAPLVSPPLPPTACTCEHIHIS